MTNIIIKEGVKIINISVDTTLRMVLNIIESGAYNTAGLYNEFATMAITKKDANDFANDARKYDDLAQSIAKLRGDEIV